MICSNYFIWELHQQLFNGCSITVSIFYAACHLLSFLVFGYNQFGQEKNHATNCKKETNLLNSLKVVLELCIIIA